MELILVKGGCFDMGDTFGKGLFVERPVHRVCLADYYIGRFEVKVGEFKQFVSETGYRTDAEKNSGCITWTGKGWKKVRDASWRQPGFNQSENHPVVCISWNDAQYFSRWLTNKTGRTYRLPTEAEWEYAARSGGKQMKWAGTDDISQLSKYANFCDTNCVNEWKRTDQNDSYIFSAPVGTYRPNDLGFYDMSGNVSEWCSDWYGATYYAESPRDDPKGPSNGDCRVRRGGSCLSDPMNMQSFNRACDEVDFLRSDLSFRLARTPEKHSIKQVGGPAVEGRANSQ